MYKQYCKIIHFALVLGTTLFALMLSTSAYAQSTATPLPASFDQHIRYQPIEPLSSSSTVETRLGWDVNVLFIDDQIEAEWIVRVEQKVSGGAWAVTDDFVKEISCAAKSATKGGDGPDIVNGVANFDAEAKDYFVCSIPSFEGAATKLIDAFLDPNSYFYTQNPLMSTGHDYATNDPIFSVLYRTLNVSDFVCTGCIDFWGAAEFEWTATSGVDSAPLLHLVDSANKNIFFTYDLHTTATSMMPQIHVSGLSDPVAVMSPSTAAIAQPLLVWTGMNPQRFYNALDTRFSSAVNESMSKNWAALWLPRALVSNLIAFSQQAVLWFSGIENTKGVQISKQSIEDFDFSADPLTLYIGHNPKTDTYFDGAITQVGVDPGCSPH